MVLGGGGFLLMMQRQGDPPTAAWVRERLWGEDLLAYEVWDGQPRAVLRIDKRVQYDLMIPGDWFWPNWPPAPQWQLMGLGYSIAYTDVPATVGFAPCVGISGERCGGPIELFGQINDSAIVEMDVLVGGVWRSFAVAAPGFVVRLDGVSAVPEGYRWLNGQGRVLHELDSASPTKPGHFPGRRPEQYERRPRERRRSFPAAPIVDSEA
jgi:hypothetical protein